MKTLRKHLFSERPGVFILFLLISLLLHLTAGFLLQNQVLHADKQQDRKEIPVTLRERSKWIELDHKPEINTTKPPENASHLANINKAVQKEAAPKGDDSRDKPAVEALQQRSAQQSSPQKKVPPPAPQPKQITPAPPLPTDTTGSAPPVVAQPESQVPVELPSLTELTKLSSKTLARMDRQQQEKRTKDRPEVELKEDEIWLNLHQMDDKLFSFFRRFHDRIEAVWNYPVEASSRNIQGTLLIKIVINKKGELVDALPLESSGSDILDYEAITAVYRAAPFGPLPSYYEHEELKIYAHFQYNLNRRMIYGQPN